MKFSFPKYWLYDLIKVEQPDWEPMMAMQSTVNWIRALAFEIEQEHSTESDSSLVVYCGTLSHSGMVISVRIQKTTVGKDCLVVAGRLLPVAIILTA